MARYANPRCAAPDPDGRGSCDVTMRPLGERHPSFGPNYKPGGWVFECPRCSAVRFLEEEKLGRYAERIR